MTEDARRNGTKAELMRVEGFMAAEERVGERREREEEGGGRGTKEARTRDNEVGRKARREQAGGESKQNLDFVLQSNKAKRFETLKCWI